MNKTNKLRVSGTRISYENVTDRSADNWRSYQFKHYGYFYRILHMLENEGFKVEKDPDVLKMFKRISKDHWYGKRGELEFTAKKYQNGFEIEFFQNVIFDNPNGGRYDFNKLSKMPYMIRLQYIVYMRKIVEMLNTLTETENLTLPPAKTAAEMIRRDLVYNWHFYKDMNFNLLTMDHEPESYYRLDRNKKPIHNGDMKYFRNSWNGYIMRGRVYYRANMQWWAIINDRKAVVVNNYDLFDDFPSGEPARMAPDRTPDGYEILREKREKAKAAALELIGDLESRGVKVPKKVKRACINEICRKQSKNQ